MKNNKNDIDIFIDDYDSVILILKSSRGMNNILEIKIDYYDECDFGMDYPNYNKLK
jgi:hypothetical protein